MIDTRFDEQSCRQALEKLDSYIDDELQPESDIDMLEHFRSCPACAREAEARRQVRSRLQTAVRRVEIPANLESRIRGNLRASRRSQNWSQSVMAIAAGVAVCFASWLAYHLGNLRVTASSQESYVSAMSGRVASIMRVGLADHIHCAVFRRFSKDTPRTLPGEFSGLLPLVEQHIPKELPLALAHECRYHGRRFIHLAFKNETSLLSVVIARKQDGEAFGDRILTAGVQRFQVAGVASGDFLVYTVSDLPGTRNYDLMAALAPALERYLRQITA